MPDDPSKANQPTTPRTNGVARVDARLGDRPQRLLLLLGVEAEGRVELHVDQGGDLVGTDLHVCVGWGGGKRKDALSHMGV